mmetsp:Transcript_11286/g.27654  ORF Transcript_11286/g.27654 Transcript_11286/m.27654 type:complete len:590 (-) Transcript_11286:848-2617(-)
MHSKMLHGTRGGLQAPSRCRSSAKAVPVQRLQPLRVASVTTTTTEADAQERYQQMAEEMGDGQTSAPREVDAHANVNGSGNGNGKDFQSALSTVVTPRPVRNMVTPLPKRAPAPQPKREEPAPSTNTPSNATLVKKELRPVQLQSPQPSRKDMLEPMASGISNPLIELSAMIGELSQYGKRFTGQLYSKFAAQKRFDFREGGLGVGAVRSIAWSRNRVAATDGRTASVFELRSNPYDPANPIHVCLWERTFGRPLDSLVKRGKKEAEQEEEQDLNVSYVALSPEGDEMSVVGHQRNGQNQQCTIIDDYVILKNDKSIVEVQMAGSYMMGGMKVVGLGWSQENRGPLLQIAAGENQLDVWGPRDSVILTRTFDQLANLQSKSHRIIAPMGDVVATASVYCKQKQEDLIAAAFTDGSIRIMCPRREKTYLLPESPFPPQPTAAIPVTLSWSPSGEQLAVACSTGIAVWEIGEIEDEPKLIFTMRVKAPVIAWSPTSWPGSGVLAVGSRLTSGIFLLDPHSGIGSDLSHPPALPTPEPVSAMCWAPLGDGLACGGTRGSMWAHYVPPKYQRMLQELGESVSYLHESFGVCKH